MLVQRFLESQAAARPSGTAVISKGREWSYGSIDAAANGLAFALLQAGLKKGERVAIQLPNCAEAVIAIFGVLKAGGVFVALNKSLREERVAEILNQAGAAGLVANSQPEFPIPALRFFVMAGGAEAKNTGQARAPVLQMTQIAPAATTPRLESPVIDLDLACLVYTSGSTGEPKGVMTDHNNMTFAASSIAEYLGATEVDRTLSVLPLAFTYGLYQLMVMFKTGGTLLLEDSFVYPVEVLEKIGRLRATAFPGVPTMFATLLRMDLGAFNLASLRYVTNAGGALPPVHIRELRRRLPAVKIYSMYGLTESKRVLYLPPDQIDIRPDSVGIPIPGTEVWLEDEKGNRLGPNQTGELVVRGRHVMRGYWRDPEATAARFRPGPLAGERVCHTGDLFRRDEEGYYYFVARKDDVIKSKGEKVAPKQVEDVICSIEGVAEAAVVGVPDPLLGQAVRAVIVLKPECVLTAGEIKAYCRMHLEEFMVPKQVDFRAELPKTAAGKVSRVRLHEPLIQPCAGLPA